MFPIPVRLYDNSFFLNHFKISIASKVFFFDLRIKRKFTPFLNLLYKLNIVRRYCFIKKGVVRVYPNWIGENSTLKKVRFFQKKTPLALTLNSLHILKTYSSNSYIILNTPKGLITHHEAMRLRTGGKLVCLIL